MSNFLLNKDLQKQPIENSKKIPCTRSIPWTAQCIPRSHIILRLRLFTASIFQPVPYFSTLFDHLSAFFLRISPVRWSLQFFITPTVFKFTVQFLQCTCTLFSIHITGTFIYLQLKKGNIR